jgi:hypothetical protein
MADEYGSSYQSDEQIGPPGGNIGLNGGARADPVQQTQYGSTARADDAGSQRGIGFARPPVAKMARNEAIPYMTEEAYGDAPVPVGGG